MLFRNRCGVVLAGPGGLEGGVTAEPSLWLGDATTMLLGRGVRNVLALVADIMLAYSARVEEVIRVYVRFVCRVRAWSALARLSTFCRWL